MVAVRITKKSPQCKAILEGLDESVVGEVEGGGRAEVIVVHDVEEKEKQWTTGGGGARVDRVA